MEEVTRTSVRVKSANVVRKRGAVEETMNENVETKGSAV